MTQKQRTICWLCLTVLTTAGLKYLPTYLVEQRKLDQQDRVLDLKERVYLKANGLPTVSVPVPVQTTRHPQLL